LSIPSRAIFPVQQPGNDTAQRPKPMAAMKMWSQYLRHGKHILKRYRFPSKIIQYAVWSYYRFNLSNRNIEDLLAERGINVSYQAIRLWCNKFGPKYAARLKKKHRGYGDTFFIDEVFIKIDGKQHYLWRAVDQVSLHHTSEANDLGIVESLMYISKNGEMVRLQSDSLKDY
jgi:hypothetical protein